MAEEAAEGVAVPPPYDAQVVGRLAARVQILNVELVGSLFEREDTGPFSSADAAEVPDSLGISPGAWAVDDNGHFGCLVTFFADFSEHDAIGPYRVVATFRLLYELEESTEIDDHAGEQFVSWNAVFNAWPYWREYLSSTINRAGLQRFLVPVMGVPRQGERQ